MVRILNSVRTLIQILPQINEINSEIKGRNVSQILPKYHLYCFRILDHE
jgi:hypothetical protein